jgi:hypothetical protein
MSADLWTTEELFFGAFCIYLWGAASLVRAELPETGRPRWTFNIPSLDAEEYRAEFLSGRLQVADLRAYTIAYSDLTYRLKQMNRDGVTLWELDEIDVSPEVTESRPESFWIDARKAISERRNERERREWRESCERRKR